MLLSLCFGFLQAGVHHGADAFLRGSLLLGTLVCAAELMALSITEMSGFCESSQCKVHQFIEFVQSARFKFQPGVNFWCGG